MPKEVTFSRAMVEVSLLISCRVPAYLMSDFETSEMRDLGGVVWLVAGWQCGVQ